ncbi:MAG: WD40/YVTN/BNR-like repeat-containing protein [Acidobacteriota bacterium]
MKTLSMKARLAGAAAFAVVFGTLFGGTLCGQSTHSVPYRWKNLQIVGGGFVDGIVFHPTAAGVRYARTDMGGAYKWDAAANRWKPILDWVSYADFNLMGVESIALDPSNPKRVYLACGTYTNPRTPNGAILRSEDGARTFQRTDVPFKFGGNEDGRGNGERMAVDPRDGRVLYLGTRHDGLWRSGDYGATWKRVESFPDIKEAAPAMPVRQPGETPEHFWRRMPIRGDGIVFVKFAPQSEANGQRTRNIYVGVSLMGRPNLFVSHDAGATWTPVAGEPTQYRPLRGALASDGTLYIAYGNAPGPSPMTNGAVWKLDTNSGAWTDITPDHPAPGLREFGYAAVAVDAHHPQWIIASSYNRYHFGGEQLFRSTDGGKSWKQIFKSGGGMFDYSAAPYVQPTPIHWLFDVEIDPANSNHAMFTTGYGGWETYDLTDADHDKPTYWKDFATGIEETVPLALVSPNDGAHLISGIGDYGGFTHWDLDRPADDGSSAPPRFGNTTDVAAGSLAPNVIVRVGINAEHKPGNISYSLDGGRTWKPTTGAPTPQSRTGSVAVSADGATWIWTPERSVPYVTHDRGATWQVIPGLAANQRIVADPVDAHVFYALSLRDAKLLRSDDDGASFSALSTNLSPIQPGGRNRGDERGGQDRLYATPGRSGDLWFPAFDGLYHVKLAPHATPPLAFTKLNSVEEIHALGFGKAAPGKKYPALYLVGTVHGQPGIFRSVDAARSWMRINDNQHQWGLVLLVTGDPRIFGRVYVGTHGRGIFYGDPAK